MGKARTGTVGPRFYLIFISLIALALPSFADDGLREIARDRTWTRLLHFSRHLPGVFKSEIDAPIFFVAENGGRDPEAELRRWIEIAESEAPDLAEENSVVCRFPARAEYLSRKLPERAVKWKRSCPRLEAWVSTVSGASVSLVFSSFYLNNPSSAFGHTLLRLNKRPAQDGRRYELLDYGVNFAANADNSNPVLYAIKGLFGGYPGTFTITPYYYKVREYNNAESRDLWEYELSLSPEAVHRLTLHLWELGPSYADYWYLTENCSYHMLTVLEAVDENLDLVSRLKTYVIPADTLKVVEETPGLVTRVAFRPSIRAEFMERWGNLTDDEKRDLEFFARKDAWPAEWSSRTEDHRRRVTDAALDWIDYKEPVQVQKMDNEARRIKDRILIERSRISESTPPIKVPIPAKEAPHLAHGSRRMGIGLAEARGTVTAADRSQTDVLLSYRFSLHDFLDPWPGLPEYASIRFFDTQARWLSLEQRFHIEDFTLFEVVSLSPYFGIVPSLSWRMKVAAETEGTTLCPGCSRSLFSGAVGRAWGLGESALIFAGVRAAVFARHHREVSDVEAAGVEGGPWFTWRQTLGTSAAIFLDGGWQKTTDRDSKGEWTGSVGAQKTWGRHGLRASYFGGEGRSQGSLEWFVYY